MGGVAQQVQQIMQPAGVTVAQAGAPVTQTVSMPSNGMNAGSATNNIQVNLAHAAPSHPQTGSSSNNTVLQASVEAESKTFSLTQDGGGIALLVLSGVLVLVSIKSFLMLSAVESSVQRIS